MVNVTINHREISVPEGTTIMEAAASIHIQIPKLCYLKDVNEISACRICVVEVEGQSRLVTSCNNVVEEGMVIYTNSPRVRRNRRHTIEMLLSQHNMECPMCVRSGNCSLQSIANEVFTNRNWCSRNGICISLLSERQTNALNVCGAFRSVIKSRE